jgi:predicted dehydrogenase
VKTLTICDPDEEALSAWGEKYRVERRARSLDDVLASGHIDAVHLVTPVNVHAEQSAAVLEAGKHCACTIPMGLTIDELTTVIAAQRNSKKNYMMMETAVYTREFLFVKGLMAS